MKSYMDVVIECWNNKVTSAQPLGLTKIAAHRATTCNRNQSCSPDLVGITMVTTYVQPMYSLCTTLCITMEIDVIIVNEIWTMI